MAVQLQKNLDRVRLKRIAHKLSTTTSPKLETPAGLTSGSRTGGFLGGNPGSLATIPRQKSPEEEDDEDEYEYEDEEEEQR